MEREVHTQIEKRKQPKYDAVFLHGYWLSQAGDNTPVQLSLRSHLVAKAAADLYFNEGVGKLVITLGEVWGPNPKSEKLEDRNSVGRIMRDELVSKYKVPSKDIILADTKALNTTTEIEEFSRLASIYNWQNIVGIACRKHLCTIPDLYTNKDPQVEYRAAEDIIERYATDERIRSFLKGLENSQYEKGYALYEAVKKALIIARLKFVLNRRLDRLQNRKAPVFFGDRFGRPMDQYNLYYDREAVEERKRQGYQFSEKHKRALERRKAL